MSLLNWSVLMFGRSWSRVFIVILLSGCSSFLWADAGGKTLLWADEFNIDGLPDSKIWGYEQGFIRNKEPQFYTGARLKNSRVENGFLHIQGLKEDLPLKDLVVDSKSEDKWRGLTSASLTTEDKINIMYGRVEVRAKLPLVPGSWPAIWMLGSNIDSVGWPKSGEVDIVERYGSEPDLVYGTVHSKKYNYKVGGAKGGTLDLGAEEMFHLYAVEWTPEKIDFFVDEKMYFSYKNEGDDDQWPFNKPMYLILNLAFEKSVPLAEVGAETSMFVDYVRVYDLK
jgi:hypothetical protein